MLLRTLAIIAITSGLVSAWNISDQCSTAIVSTLESPAAACLNPSGLVAIATAGNNSIIPAVDTWLTGLCALDPCTDSNLSTITTNILTPCAQDLGLMPSDIPALVTDVQIAYPTVRKVVCLEDTTTNTNCVTETLNNIQSTFGTLSIDNIDNVINQILSGPIPQNIICTDCIKEAYNIFNQELPDTVADLTAPLQAECGASFLDGQVPSDIIETAKGTNL